MCWWQLQVTNITVKILWPKMAGFGFIIINWLPNPTQTKPSPLNPSLHSHVYEPGVFVHVATAWHWWAPFPWHSSTSWHSTPSPMKPVKHYESRIKHFYDSYVVLMWNRIQNRIPTVKLKIPGNSIFEIRNQNFCLIQVMFFELSYLPVAAVGT